MMRPDSIEAIRKAFGRKYRFLTRPSLKLTCFIGRRFPSIAPLTFVIGFPRSGTMWVTEIISQYLGLPYVDMPLVPVLTPAVYHGHELMSKDYRRGVYVIRDGRDAMVSHYFFLTGFLTSRDAIRKRLGLISRSIQPLHTPEKHKEVKAALSVFIKWQMDHPTSAPANWGEHIRLYFETNNQNMPIVRYEDMLVDAEKTMDKVLSKMLGEKTDSNRLRAIVEMNEFEKNVKNGRRRGEEDRLAFRRKGIRGDWKNYFSRQSAEIFNYYCGEALIKAGYEKDSSWIDICK